jgi:hypothetical protein
MLIQSLEDEARDTNQKEESLGGAKHRIPATWGGGGLTFSSIHNKAKRHELHLISIPRAH